MSVQLDLLEPQKSAPRGAVWSRLPASARREVLEIFAALLALTVRSRPVAEEDSDESIED